MKHAELKTIAQLIRWYVPDESLRQTLAYQIAQAFPAASFNYGRRNFLYDCGTEPTSDK